jgi:RNA polymerase sigma-54 factor
VSFIALQTDRRQSQTLSPRLQHAVRLLQMSSLDFAALVQDSLGKNPFLEADEAGADGADRVETEPSDGGGDGGGDGGDDGDDGGGMEGRDGWSDAADVDDRSDRDLWHNDAAAGPRSGDGGAGSGPSALDLIAVPTALNTHLHGQIRVLPLSPRDLALAQTVIESLDDDGYLRTPLDELLAVPALEPTATRPEMRIALRRIQSLDPAGVGARSVAECLLLQLPAIACPQLRGLAQAIVRDHLPALAARDVAGLARRLGQTPAQVAAVCERIRRLDAHPGARFSAARVAHVVPDVVVKPVRGVWTVQLNPAVVPKVRLNEVYAQQFQRHRTAQHAELGAHLQDARWTVRNVEQRFATILDVAQAIVDRQRHFLAYGAMAMKPLGLREIAEAVGAHVSTVSRATANKFLATPSGVYELKSFFSRSMVSANGSACSGTAIRSLIKDILEAENVDAPLSDAQITRELAQQGLVVARRTVTKYRQMLKIEPVDRRGRQDRHDRHNGHEQAAPAPQAAACGHPDCRIAGPAGQPPGLF